MGRIRARARVIRPRGRLWVRATWHSLHRGDVARYMEI